MLDYSIMSPEGILILTPHAPLTKEDFAGLGVAVDTYLAGHPILQGVLIHSREFPGWEDFGGFAEHLHFVREHRRKVERLALVTDSAVAGVAEFLAGHFTSAKVMHFPFAEYAQALEWLRTT
jgi:hypothetical protein